MCDSSATLLRPLRRTLAVSSLAVVAAAVLVACQPGLPEAAAAAASAVEPPIVPVAVVTPSTADLSVPQIARIESAQRVDIQARVAGPIEAVLFTEGGVVRAGQPLFQIDPRPYDAAVARARAEVLLAEAQASLAARELERARQLHADRAIASELLDRRHAAHDEAQARRAIAEAALQTARLDREFTVVRSPINGRAGRALVTAGNFVAAGSHPTPLVSIVGTSPLHVHFDVSDRRVIDRLDRAKSLKSWKARILDADSGQALAEAPVDFAHHSIDADTGTLRLRARLDTPESRMLPGQYVRVQLDTGTTEPVITVPDKAIGTDQGQRYVLVVDAEGKVAYRPVGVGAMVADRRIVTSGLTAGEQVVVSGLMRVRPGMTVKPQAAAEPAQAPATTLAQS